MSTDHLADDVIGLLMQLIEIPPSLERNLKRLIVPKLVTQQRG